MGHLLYVVWCGSRRKHHEDMCWEDIRWHVQSMLAILNSKVNIILGDIVWPFNEHNNFHFVNG